MAGKETDQKKRSVWPTVFAGLALLLLFVYPLSIGPAYWIVKNTRFTHQESAWELVEDLYAPVVWAAIGTNTEELLVEYITWFIDR